MPTLLRAGNRIRRDGGRERSLFDVFSFLVPRRRRRCYWFVVAILSVTALLPPLIFHFKLRRFHQDELKKCRWISNPPLICAHGGDSTRAFPNTMAAYEIAIGAQVDCMELDVSRSTDGALFALHDRDLQAMTGNISLKVGHLSSKEIKALVIHGAHPGERDGVVPMVEDALKMVSNSVRRVILDVKVGPPSYEKQLAEDVLSVVESVSCVNCVVWSKSEEVVREMVKLSLSSSHVPLKVGYIVMVNRLIGMRSVRLSGIRGATVAGVYHGLVNDRLVAVFHTRNEEVYAWTVDHAHVMHDMLSQNVDGIVTGNPSMLRQLMHDQRTRCLIGGHVVNSLQSTGSQAQQ